MKPNRKTTIGLAFLALVGCKAVRAAEPDPTPSDCEMVFDQARSEGQGLLKAIGGDTGKALYTYYASPAKVSLPAIWAAMALEGEAREVDARIDAACMANPAGTLDLVRGDMEKARSYEP